MQSVKKLWQKQQNLHSMKEKYFQFFFLIYHQNYSLNLVYRYVRYLKLNNTKNLSNK